MATTEDGIFYLDSVWTGQYPSVYWQLFCYSDKNWVLVCNKSGSGSFSGGTFTVTITLSTGASQTIIVTPPLHNYNFDYVNINTQIPAQTSTVGVYVTVRTVNYTENYNTDFSGIYEPQTPGEGTFSITNMSVSCTSTAEFKWTFLLSLDTVQDEYTTLKNGLTLRTSNMTFNENVASRRSTRAQYIGNTYSYHYDITLEGNNQNAIKALYTSTHPAKTLQISANVSMKSAFTRSASQTIETTHERETTVSVAVITPPPTFSSGWYSVAVNNTTSGGSSTFAYWIKDKSRARVTFDRQKINVSNLCGASIASYRVVVNNSSSYTALAATDTTEIDTNAMIVVGSNTLTVYAVDTRGNEYQAVTSSVTVYDYADPTLSSVSVYRCDEDGIQEDSGTYLYIRALASFSSVGGHNSITLRARYRPSSGDYGSYFPISNNIGVVKGDGLIDLNTVYYVEIYAIDAAGFSTSIVDFVRSRVKTFHVKDGGKAVGVGMVVSNEDDYTYHVGFDTYLYGTLTIGNTTITESDLQQLLALIENS